jgi:methyltransferase (TIGR00027 family)
MNCALLSKDPGYRALFNDPFAAKLVEAVSPEGASLLARLDDPAARAAFIAAGEAKSPGLITHVLYRKPFVERAVREAVAAGCRQVVVLGAGMDTLALRLAGAAPVYEVDRPETQALKRRALAAIGAPDGLRFAPVDFARETMAEKLLSAGHDPAARSVFVAEAVMEYVPPADVDGIFAFVRSCAPGSRFVFSFMSSKLLETALFKRLNQEIAREGEPIRFTLAPEALESFLADRGFRLRELLTPKQARARLQAEHPGLLANTLGGFYLAVAENL